MENIPSEDGFSEINMNTEDVENDLNCPDG